MADGSFDIEDALAALEELRTVARSAGEKAADRGAQELVRVTRGTTPVKSGRLKNSIFADPVRTAGATFRVDVAPHTIYARIQDLGGEIVPKRARFLSWEADGVRHFARSVYLPGSRYFQRGMDEAMGPVQKAIEQAFREAFGG